MQCLHAAQQWGSVSSEPLLEDEAVSLGLRCEHVDVDVEWWGAGRSCAPEAQSGGGG